MNSISDKTEILIVGAGASGLMLARELSRTGKKVIILEARDRIGGRIFPLDEKDFGYPVQGGAEFVHGKAPVTKQLLIEAGLTFIPESGEIWSMRNGALTKVETFIESTDLFKQELDELKEDMPIASFLRKYFADNQYANLRNSITKMVEGYDAADPERMSTFTIREEWSGREDIDDGYIKEGYGALLKFLERQCLANGVTIHINSCVKSVNFGDQKVIAVTTGGKTYESQKIVVTVALPTFENINFSPALPEKIEAVSKIGFGNVIKLILKFKTRWWKNALDQDFSKMHFMICNEPFMTWWNHYPEIHPIMIGWMAGKNAEKYKDLSPRELFDMGLATLAKIFKVDANSLKENVVKWEVINWPADPLTLGAYSYTTSETKGAYEDLLKPVKNTVYFAGEALCLGDETATVEGALASGKEVAAEILSFTSPPDN